MTRAPVLSLYHMCYGNYDTYVNTRQNPHTNIKSLSDPNTNSINTANIATVKDQSNSS